MYQRYAQHVLRHGTYLESTIAAVQPGDVLTSLEGIRWGDQQGVVLDVEDQQGGMLVTVWLTQSKETKQYRVPSDAASQARLPPEEESVNTVYDPLMMNYDLPPIRRLPDSYWPPDPNNPNMIQDTLWRPTVRRSPIFRFYQAGEIWKASDEAEMPWDRWNARLHPCPADGHPELHFTNVTDEGWADCWNVVCQHRDGSQHDFGCAETPEEGISAWNDHVRQRGASTMKRRRAELRRDFRGHNPPKPDVFVPRVDEEGHPIAPLHPDLIGYNIDPYEPSELAMLAVEFYKHYQRWREDVGTQYITPTHQNADVYDYALAFADRFELDRDSMDTLWRYMVEIGMWPQTEYDAWLVYHGEDAINGHRWDDLA